MEVCREALNTRDAPDPPTDDVVHLIALILKKNNFSFNGENYLQKHGTVMGTWMAPSIANLFMGKLEKNLLCWATQTYHLVEVHRQHICCLDTQGGRIDKNL